MKEHFASEGNQNAATYSFSTCSSTCRLDSPSVLVLASIHFQRLLAPLSPLAALLSLRRKLPRLTFLRFFEAVVLSACRSGASPCSSASCHARTQVRPLTRYLEGGFRGSVVGRLPIADLPGASLCHALESRGSQKAFPMRHPSGHNRTRAQSRRKHCPCLRTPGEWCALATLVLSSCSCLAG